MRGRSKEQGAGAWPLSRLSSRLPAQPCAAALLLLPRSPKAPSTHVPSHARTHLPPMRCSYIGVTERDYEWLTEQIVAVANR